jgi:hypothetical protein
VPIDEPTPIGPDIDQLLNGLLPASLARERERLLRNHEMAVVEVRERAHRAWQEMLSREVTMVLLSGIAERVADLAAKNNLAVRKRELDDELHTELARLQEELTRRVRHLIEGKDDEREGERGEAPSA